MRAIVAVHVAMHACEYTCSCVHPSLPPSQSSFLTGRGARVCVCAYVGDARRKQLAIHQRYDPLDLLPPHPWRAPNPTTGERGARPMRIVYCTKVSTRIASVECLFTQNKTISPPPFLLHETAAYSSRLVAHTPSRPFGS